MAAEKESDQMITLKIGNLLEATEDIIAHQVNCQGVAGGLAWEIFNKWPEAKLDYEMTVNLTPVSRDLLGRISTPKSGSTTIVNLYAQYFPGADYNYIALAESLARLAQYAKKNNMSVALPFKLSCGIAGGDWKTVLPMIQRMMEGIEVTIYAQEQSIAGMSQEEIWPA